MSSVEPNPGVAAKAQAKENAQAIILSAPPTFSVALPKHPNFKISLADLKIANEHKAMLEKLKNTIEVHEELNECLKKLLQAGKLDIKLYTLQSSEWPYSPNVDCVWEKALRVLFLKTKFEFNAWIELFFYGIIAISKKNLTHCAQFKNAHEFILANERCQYDIVMLRNQFITQGFEKYGWPQSLKESIIDGYPTFESYFKDRVEAYENENTMSLYDQSCQFYANEMQKIHYKAFQEEVAKNLGLDPAWTDEEFLNKVEPLKASLEKQLRLIEMAYQMFLDEKLILGLYRERAKLYRLQQELKPREKALDASRKHAATMQDIFNKDENDKDAEQDKKSAKALLESAQRVYDLHVKKIEEMKKIIKESEDKIIVENKSVLDGDEGKTRAEAELKRIQTRYMLIKECACINKQKSEELAKQAAAKKQASDKPAEHSESQAAAAKPKR